MALRYRCVAVCYYSRHGGGDQEFPLDTFTVDGRAAGARPFCERHGAES